MSNAELVRWSIKEIRGLDELARSMIPNYAPLDSDDMSKIKKLERLADTLEKEDE